MIWATVNSQSFYCCWLLYRASLFLAAKNIINMISLLTIWWCPCVVFSCVVGRGCLPWPVHSLGKTLLAFALIHFVCQAKFACYFLTIIQMKWQIHSRDYIWYIECLKNYEWKFATLYRRQWSRSSPRKRNAKRQYDCLRRQRRKDLPIWMQSSKE